MYFKIELLAFLFLFEKLMFVVMQIVPTEYRYLSHRVMPTNQFSVTEYFVPIRAIDRSWPGWHFHCC